MPDGTHAADQRVVIQKALVVNTSELATAIRMQYHRPLTLALPDRHLRRSNHDLPILTVRSSRIFTPAGWPLATLPKPRRPSGEQRGSV